MMNEALLNVNEDSSEHYMDVDLTEYASASQPVVPETSSVLSEQPQQSSLLIKAEVQPPKESAGQSVDSAEKVDLPEGM